MAFPDDYKWKFKAPLDAANISATLLDYPARFLLPDVAAAMMNASSEGCLNGGGDIRCGNEDGSVQYPLHIVRCVTSATASSREFEAHVKVPSVSSSSDTDVWFFYKNAGDSQPSPSSTYGSENVYDSDFELNSHDGGKTNSTSGSDPSIFTTEPSAASGKYDDTEARDYGSRTEIEGYSLSITGTTEYTFVHQIYSRSVDNNSEISFYRIDYSGFTSLRFGYQYNDEFWLTDDTNYLGGSLAGITEDTWQVVTLAQDGASDGEIYVDGASVYSGSTLNAPSTAETSLFIGVGGTGTNELDGLIAEVNYSKIRRDDAWNTATQDNINDQVNFFKAPSTPELVAGSTTYEQSVSGSMTPSGAISRSIDSIKFGSLTPSGTISRDMTKGLSGAVTPTGGLIKAITKLFSGSFMPEGALQAVLAYQRTFTGSMTPTGSLERLTSLLLDGSATPSGTIQKLITKAFLGAVTPAGLLTLGSDIKLDLTGSTTPSGNLLKQTNKFLFGSSEPSGSIQKQMSKILLGVLTPSATLQRQVEKVLDGSLTPTGTIIVSAVILLLLTGQVIVSGTLATLFIAGSGIAKFTTKIFKAVFSDIFTDP